MTLQELREKRNAKVAQMRGILDAAPGGDLSAEDIEKYDALDKELDGLNAQITREERLQGLEHELDEPEPSAGQRQFAGGRAPGPEASREFGDFGEFMHAVRFNPNDQRLNWQEASLHGEQRMDNGTDGGFAVPAQFRGELLEVEQSPAAVRPRATVIPAGSPPDAPVSMPALDQSDAANMYGGVEVDWINEGGEKPETGAKLREVTMQPQEVAAHITVTDKLLRNWQAAGALLGRLLRQAIMAAEDHKFMIGSGAGAPLGFINSGAGLTVNRETADDVTYTDVVGMESNLLANAQPVWITTRRCAARMRFIKDEAGQYIWSGARDGLPPTLLGYPVQIVPRMPSRGNKGDLVLVDLSYYLIKDGSGPFVAASEHVHFKNNKTVIKAFWNVDGQPWLKGPIKQENGDTQSPFVLLDVPEA